MPTDTGRSPFLEHAERIWRGSLSAKALEEIMGNFAVLADRSIGPHLAFENQLKIMQATWEQRTDALYAQSIHDVPLQRPELIAERIRGFANAVVV